MNCFTLCILNTFSPFLGKYSGNLGKYSGILGKYSGIKGNTVLFWANTVVFGDRDILDSGEAYQSSTAKYGVRSQTLTYSIQQYKYIFFFLSFISFFYSSTC